MGTKIRGATARAVAFRYATYFAHRWGFFPKPESAADVAAIYEVVKVQALGHEDRALELVEAIVEAPLPCVNFAARYAAYWAWVTAQRPKRYSPPSRSLAREIRACIAGRAA